MKHGKYHTLRRAAVSAFEGGNPEALVSMIQSEEQLYLLQEWSNWGPEEHIVFGMLSALEITTRGMTRNEIEKNEIWGLCVAVAGKRAALDVARLVWEEFS